MSEQDYKMKVEAFFASACDGNVDRLDDIVHPDYVMHDPSLPQECRGIAGAKEVARFHHVTLGGPQITFHREVVAGDSVTTIWTVRGTHAAEIAGVAPSGKAITIEGITVSRFLDGKIVEEWEVCDMAGVLAQIGALPEPAAV